MLYLTKLATCLFLNGNSFFPFINYVNVHVKVTTENKMMKDAWLYEVHFLPIKIHYSCFTLRIVNSAFSSLKVAS